MRIRALVTGGLGFIGSNLSKVLVDSGFEVVIIDNLLLGERSNVASIKDKVKIIIGDILNISDLQKAGKVDYIFHLAGASASPMFNEKSLAISYRTNIEGFLNVLQFAHKSSVKKVLFASTSSIYANKKLPLKEISKVTPPNFYSVTKLAMEHTARVFNRLYGLEIIGFRFFSVYGKNEKSKGVYANIASQFLWKIRADHSPTIYGDGSQKRDFVYVEDVAQALVEVAISTKKIGFDVFNIGTGKQYSFNELVDLINKVLDKKVRAKHIVNPMVKSYIYSQNSDTTKIKGLFGWEPKVTLEEGINRLANTLD